MANNKLRYLLIFVIIISLSLNVFAAANSTDDSSSQDVSESSDSTGEETQTDDNNQANEDTDENTDDNQDNQNNKSNSFDFSNFTNSSNNSFNFSSFNFSNMSSNRSSNSSFNISDIISRFMNQNNTNDTNSTETNETNETEDPEVTDVPEVVTKDTYKPTSQSTVKANDDTQHAAQHIIKRARDNKIVSQGDSLKLEGVNKLYDSDFRNGHLLVYMDGKLVFNEITSDDLSVIIFGITNDNLGQHQLKVEFTDNEDSNSNTNTFTEDIIIE